MMANYNQTQTSVSATYRDYMLSNTDDSYWLILGTDDYYVCVSSDDKPVVTGTLNDCEVTFGDSSTIQTITRGSYNTTSGIVSVSQDATTVKITYPYYTYSNIGVGTAYHSVVDANRDSSNLQNIFGIGVALCIITLACVFLRRRFSKQ